MSDCIVSRVLHLPAFTLVRLRLEIERAIKRREVIEERQERKKVGEEEGGTNEFLRSHFAFRDVERVERKQRVIDSRK